MTDGHGVADGGVRPVAETLEAELRAIARALPERIEADPEHVESGLARLVLTVVELLRKVLEHQAVRRMDGGTLTEAEVERLGLALMKLNDRMQELKALFNLSDEDLSIDLGPLGRLR
ncbi:MAG TPA: gas vesicle protein K [Gemmatimonadaceae bacterium]|nr:gas vesicle protein K [Gemmatimonadaceae bacterium]